MDTGKGKLLAIAALSLAASAAFAAPQSFDKRFDAAPGGHLTVDTDLGSVAIVGRDAHAVVIHAQMDDSDHLQVTAEQTTSGVSVAGHVTDRGWFDWFHVSSSHVRFTIEVPRDYSVELKTSGGSLDVRELTGSVRGKTSGGRIEAERIHGNTKLDTSGGSIEIVDSTGDLDVNTSGGSITLKGVDGRIKAFTSGGGIDAELRSNHGVTLSTSGGSITLLLPAGLHASLDADTSGGRVRSQIPLSTTEIAETTHLRGTLNGGGEPIHLHTSGGSIVVGPLG